ncbi:MAG: hypothetical protein ABL949_02830 [Fimbriimonadaceae bacterium]
MKKAHRWKKWTLLVGVCTAAAVLVGIALELNRTRAAEREIAVEVARIHAAGFPMTLTELQRPGQENAVAIYQSAMRLRKLGAASSTVLAEVTRASKVPYCLYEDLHRGTFHDWYLQMKDLMELVLKTADLKAKSNDFRSAFNWLEVARAMVTHMRQPIEVGLVYGLNLEMSLLFELQKQTRSYSGRPEFVDGARKLLGEIGAPPSLKATISGQIISARWWLREFDSGRDPNTVMRMLSDDEKGSLFALKFASVRRRVELRLLTRYRRLIDELPSNASQLNSTLSVAKKINQEFHDESTVVNRLSSLFCGAEDIVVEGILRLEAMRRVTRTGLELFAYRAQTGSFPKSLDTIKPDALDPFTGQPLRYYVVPDGIDLYSVGSDHLSRVESRKNSLRGRATGDDISFFRPHPQ